MKLCWNRFVISLLPIALGAPAFGADIEAGRMVFRQQCTICHTAEDNDQGGAQGPALSNIYGKPAASSTSFAYTQALRDAKLMWDAATLNKFLESPTAVAPGSAMVVAVSDANDRDNLVAYLQSIKGSVSAASSSAPTGSDAADWRKDKPGRVHRIDVDALPKPFDTPSVRNAPKSIERPANAELSVPEGFKVDVYATQLQGPRRMLVTANGDVLVSETRAGRISILHPAKDGKSATASVYVEGLKQPFGMAFFPNAKNPQWLYIAETHRIVRYTWRNGDVKPHSDVEVVVPEVPAGRGHFTRDVLFSADGKHLYVAVGSASNVAEGLPRKTVAEAQAWEAEHGLGAAWDYETNRAAVLEYEIGSNGTVNNASGKVFASGIRNCVSLAMQPQTHDLWCTTNERDLLGDDLVPDYSTRITRGGFYGWPWYYLGNHEDPRLPGERPDLAGKVIMPDVLYQAHSAALNLTFYPATQGKAAFPKEYVGDAFVAFHGSWNRNFRTGYKIVRVRMKNGVPTGGYEDFMTGFIVDDGNVWGRPVATTVLHDGSLLVSDDAANQIYRVYYR